ncbi:SagB/ThcOx family dehydrogenase [Methylobacterium aquaticum]|uniref:SagB/ThcOx family dehydrogenase n=1 Tax=Methylobacterium aquaticum TaxID=270351 RepID=UPI003D16DE8E
MSEDEPWTADRLGRALQDRKKRLEAERRAAFLPLGIDAECRWPASRLFHRHSMLGPAWTPILTADEVEALTLDRGYKRYPGADRVALPRPAALNATLEDAIASRHSERSFADRPVSLDAVATLMRLGAGVTADQEVPRRAAPSPGALYPVETYVFALSVNDLAPGLYHYDALDHAFETVAAPRGREATRAFLPSDLHRADPALLIALTVAFPRVQMKYLERGYRFALLEAGHIGQNLVLAAAALDLAAVPVGGFWDEPFNDALGLDPDEEAVVYAVIVGHRP